MQTLHTVIIIISAITLFIFGLQSFSKEIESFGIENLQRWIKKMTNLPLGGFILGGAVTAVIQSSTLVSSLTVSLVDSGIISFRDSLMILLGTNIGTTSTGWIVSYQSDMFGPALIVLGTLISMAPSRIAVAGKSIFYFGFIFFALNLISISMEPIKNDPMLLQIMEKATNPILGIIYGIIITIIIQSSSVVVGLVIVLVSQGVVPLNAAIAIVVGANIGTTSTALLVSLKLSPMSKLVAASATGFNIIGVLIMLPFFGVLEQFARYLTDSHALQVAAAFTASNTFTSVFFLIFFKPTLKLLQKTDWYKDGMQSIEQNKISSQNPEAI
ncbi:Na/Pi symporter [Flavobacterium agricola]|uniref:Na/Pi symporter n=1 Tax=Flavobacterium agricola TaxID=2870839 RepID=A0ABY6M1X3_9FLAO|nr:Na/Pi symporter [Flavobacterium agricola]UYW01710.1 Na/Pi symporter [Flavobacterium agricola]